MNWIKVKDALPVSGQEVLVYWDERESFDCEQYHILIYYKKGDEIYSKDNKEIKNPKVRLLDSMFNEDNKVYAEEDGFYFYIEEGMQRHNDSITHWAPLVRPKDIKSINKIIKINPKK